MSDDLTRWNRAGLARFRYVEGNAATYLDELREALRLRFDPRWTRQLEPPPDGTEGFTTEERDRNDPYVLDVVQARHNEHLVEQYTKPRHEPDGDLVWELTRAFARACHVLTEHIDAHANEGYLRTATQWDHVRRLIETIDHRPAPAVSASTWLILEVAQGRRGVVERGFQVRHAPPDGGEAIVFETLEDLEVDHALDGLALRGSDRSELPLSGQDDSVRFPAAERVVVAHNAPSLLIGPNGAEATRIAGVDPQTGAITATIPSASRAWPRGEVQLAVAPQWSRRAWLNGPEVARTAAPHGLAAGAHVVWRDANDDWVAASVVAADVRGLRFDKPPPPPGTVLYVASPIRAGVVSSEGDFVPPVSPLQPSVGPNSVFDVDALEEYLGLLQNQGGGSILMLSIPQIIQIAIAIMAKDLKIPSTGETPLLVMAGEIASLIGDLLDLIDPGGTVDLSDPNVNTALGNQIQGLLGALHTAPDPWLEAEYRFQTVTTDALFIRRDAQPKATVVEQEPRYVFEGRVPGIGSGEWVIGEQPSSQLRAFQVGEIGEKPDESYFWMELVGANQVTLERAFARFRARVRPTDAAENREVPAQLELEQRPPLLDRGRRVLLVAEDGAVPPMPAIVTDVDGPVIEIDPPPSPGFTKGNLRIHGNLVLAGHGRRRPERVLSSGPELRDHATIVLEVDEPSTIADPTWPDGHRPDIEVEIGGRRWEPVPSLARSRHADPHFEIRTTEQGYLRLRFGDGQRGRRLPAGTDNVRIRYRVGAGRRGNLERGRLAEPVGQHSLVVGVRQPIDATGGEDVEQPELIRERAPATLLTFGRAVSREDFERLATSRRDVWHARAFYSIARGGRRYDRVDVVVMPSGGAPLQTFDPLHGEIESYLRRHAIPTVEVHVRPHVPQPQPLAVRVRIRHEQFEPPRVVAATRRALLDAFSPERRGIGRELMVAEIYRVVEQVPGVEDSVVFVPGQARVLPRSPRHALFVTEDDLEVREDRYTP